LFYGLYPDFIKGHWNKQPVAFPTGGFTDYIWTTPGLYSMDIGINNLLHFLQVVLWTASGLHPGFSYRLFYGLYLDYTRALLRDIGINNLLHFLQVVLRTLSDYTRALFNGHWNKQPVGIPGHFLQVVLWTVSGQYPGFFYRLA
jgi:hypothetical protein